MTQRDKRPSSRPTRVFSEFKTQDVDPYIEHFNVGHTVLDDGRITCLCKQIGEARDRHGIHREVNA